MSSRRGHRRGTLAVAALCLLGCTLLMAALSAPARAARLSSTLLAIPAESRPPQGVATARIAVVRVLTYYTGSSSSGALSPDPTPCAADGVIVGTTGANLNSFTYVLTPTSAVNPITPCAGAQAAYQQLYGPASSWSIGHIDVLLNVAYTGLDGGEPGSIVYAIDPSQITTNGGASGPPVLALPLTNPAKAPAHDLPVLSVPQPSDAPADNAPFVLDLTGADGSPLGVDALTSDRVKTTLYPVAVPASQLSQEPVATPTKPPTATPPEQTVVGGTAAATQAQQVPTASLNAPTALSTQIMAGAPEIDSNGRLVGMVVTDAHGNHVIAPLSALTHQIGAVSGRPGTLMTQWQQGMTAYYANPPQFTQAAATFSTLASAYPDFKGVTPFATAARNQSTTIAPLTSPAGSGTPTTSSRPVASSTRSPLLPLVVALGGMALLIVLAWLLLVTRSRRRAKGALAPVEQTATDEANLNLLPPDMTLDAVPPLDMEQTIPLAAVGAAAPASVDGQATLWMPAVKSEPARIRKGLALMPNAAGLTDPGIKRADDPNQDNIIALQGFRKAGGRMQPFGLFIVADGMGGHLHGQEASKLAIEIVGKAVLQTLSTSQAMTESALLELLRDSVRKAAEELHERNLRDRVDMGTTMAAALVADDMAYIVNVGDSRVYLMSPETGLRQLTTDHSIVASLVASGVIRPEDIYTHPRRNQIYRSLGGSSDGQAPDTFETPLQAGDKLLLCSDGLWEMVRDPQIERILRGAADPRQAAELLVREANENGGEDNISAIVVRLLEDVPANAQPGVQVVVAPEGSVNTGS